MSYSNPAFAALGIKSFKLPSRNWLIFWSVVGTLTGGIIFDKWKQRQLRDEFMKQYQNQNLNYPIDQIHRKLRIYISPPPNDYLDESMKYFRRFVKPIINASGLDYQIITMERQGDIRFKVAEEIRNIRRELAGIPIPEKKQDVSDNDAQINETGKSDAIHSPVFNFKVDESKRDPTEDIKQVRDLYKPMDVLGIKKIFGDFEDKIKNVKYEDALVNDVRNSGGIICIGRGAFKEYINGVHEGLLGPLDEPVKEINESINLEDDDKKAEAEDKEDNYAPAAYIFAKDYKDCEIAPELGLNKIDFENDEEINKVLQTLRSSDKNIPFFFTQPILELRNYNVSGFTRQPERMWRFYNKRDQLIEYNLKLVNLIYKNWCPFNENNLNDGIEEENDWPSSWLKTAKQNNSEWVRDFAGDNRVLKLLSSYNCDCNDNKNENRKD